MSLVISAERVQRGELVLCAWYFGLGTLSFVLGTLSSVLGAWSFTEPGAERLPPDGWDVAVASLLVL